MALMMVPVQELAGFIVVVVCTLLVRQPVCCGEAARCELAGFIMVIVCTSQRSLRAAAGPSDSQLWLVVRRWSAESLPASSSSSELSCIIIIVFTLLAGAQ